VAAARGCTIPSTSSKEGTFPTMTRGTPRSDIEFYGNKDPNSTLIATNIITNGYERLEQVRAGRKDREPGSSFIQYST